MVGDFAEERDDDVAALYPPEESQDLADFVRRGGQDHGGKPGLLLATTTTYQEEAVAELRGHGFEVLSEFTNPKTKRTVTLWGLKVNQPRAKPEKVTAKVMPAHLGVKKKPAAKKKPKPRAVYGVA